MKEHLIQFREQSYQRLYLYNRADVIFDTIDALCCAEGVQSLAELTLLPAFRGRQYSRLYQDVAHFPLRRRDTVPLLLRFEPRPRRRPFRLYSIDVEPVSRPYAECLWDQIVSLAYCQLWLAHSLAQARWRPWERHLARKQASFPARALSPTHV